jgi:hypothetical protein
VFPNDEKSCAGFVSIKKIEQLGGYRGIRPVVKGESKLAGRIRAANRRAKEL